MNRPILVCALMLMATAALGAQEASQSSPYQGTSTPPADDTIETSSQPQAKPPAGQPAAPEQAQPAPAAQSQPQPPYQPQPSPVDPSVNYQDPDGGIVQGQRNASGQAALTDRYAADPDGDIVHPHPLRPGELQEGTAIRVRLLERLSTRTTEKGEVFRSRVGTDVLQGGQVLIPAGSEIDGRVVEVSSGHAGGRGTMRLRPETVILPDGSRFHLNAEVTGTPGSRTHVGGEGTILPDSRLKRDGIEYGGAVAAGATTGAIVGGPVGALTGTLIGAGVVTVHLLVSHPQAVLEPGTSMVFTTTDRLNLVRETSSLK
ncbi:MAG: hypothetical protein ABSE87_08950 [Terracidiphilus sp.]|jgi:hypothetical protein